jgi:Flp pilus assembly protein TadG
VKTHRKSAQAIVELAIAMPVLLWFALGTLDFGRVFYTYIGLTNAAREGARRATLLAPACTSSVLSTVQSAVQNEQASLSIPTADIQLDCTYTDRRAVTISNYLFQPVTPFIGRAVGDLSGKIHLTTSATLPVVNQ